MKADINVTPLIDVLLVLLIIFMCVAPHPPRALAAGLPRTDSAGATGRALVLEVGADTLALNGAPVLTFADLDRRLRAALETRGDGTVFVKPDADVPYEKVIAAIDVADGAGASRVGLVAVAPDDGRR
jgi:biopolymer transport protein TolR